MVLRIQNCIDLTNFSSTGACAGSSTGACTGIGTGACTGIFGVAFAGVWRRVSGEAAANAAVTSTMKEAKCIVLCM
jgi:hypothetical protein